MHGPAWGRNTGAAVADPCQPYHRAKGRRLAANARMPRVAAAALWSGGGPGLSEDPAIMDDHGRPPGTRGEPIVSAEAQNEGLYA